MPETTKGMGLNMSWKKVYLCHVRKKLFVFDQGERKSYVFLLEEK